MEYFVYCRARPDAETVWASLVEAHWSYMDGFAEAMIARGPTLTADRETATGSVHIVDLPDLDAATWTRSVPSPSTNRTIERASTRTCSSGDGAMPWDAPCGTSPATRRGSPGS